VRYDEKCVSLFMHSTLDSFPSLIKFEFSGNLKKYSNIKFHENSPSGSRVVPWRLADKRT
jgi:hypothetical protein